MHSIDAIALLDWKRRVAALYEEVSAASVPVEGWTKWRGVRDEMFREHPQSPIPEGERESFRGLEYFDFDPSYRVLAEITEIEPRHFDIGTSGDGAYGFTRFATASFALAGTQVALELYWLDGYGGGLFLPFRDATAGTLTYGGGRYLLDTVKGADLGEQDGRLVLDFNFAYNPSCSYDPRWVCPLAPPANRIDVPIEAGEKHR